MPHILLCMPNEAARLRIAALLGKRSYSYVSCEEVNEAFRLFRLQNADLLLISAELGMEDLTQLREAVRHLNDSVPILYLNANRVSGLWKFLSDGELDDCMLDDTNSRELFCRIRGLIKRSRKAAAMIK